MSAIDTQNAKQIRDPMLVRGMLKGINDSINDYTRTGDIKIEDYLDYNSASWPMRKLTDLKGSGYSLDGSCVLYDEDVEASKDNGKIGLRSDVGVGSTMTVVVEATVQMSSITINVTNGAGTVTYAGTTYNLETYTIVPINDSSTATLVFTSTAATRLEIRYICAGVYLSMNNNNVVRCNPVLRSFTDPDNPSWAVSEIEWQVYYKDDIESAVASVAEDTILYYKAGYEDDLQDIDWRRFYLTGKITQDERGVLTIRGVDASNRLTKDAPADLFSYPRVERIKVLYNIFIRRIRNAGITLLSTETAPTPVSTGGESVYCYIPEEARSYFTAFFMNTWHDRLTNSTTYNQIGARFWPVFVDAGWPKVTWSYPTKKWTISEADCGDVCDEYDRNLNKISTYQRNTTVENYIDPAGKSWYREDIDVVDAKAGVTYTVEFDEPYTETIVNNATTVKRDLNYFRFKAKTTAKCKVQGRKVKLTEDALYRSYTRNRPGKEVELDYVFNSATSCDKSVWGYGLIMRSNHTVSFRWKGDPRMQPRDVFQFNRLDGTTKNYTIESIDLLHEGGGTSCTIVAREGVV